MKKNKDLLLDLLTDIDMLLLVGKGIRSEICDAIYRYAQGNDKYMKNYNKYKESSYLKHFFIKMLIYSITQETKKSQ